MKNKTIIIVLVCLSFLKLDAQLKVFNDGHVAVGSVNYTRHDFFSYDNTIKSFIDINGNGCESKIVNGQNFILRARDYINIKEVDSKYFSDFTVKIENCP